MIRRISFYDVLSLDEFSGLTQFDLLKRSMDYKVAPYLFKMGADVDQTILVQACRHRTLDGEDKLGYTYVAMERTDKNWLDSPFSTMAARVHSQTDKELSSDMLKMSKEGMDFSRFKQMALAAATKAELALARERREEFIPVETYGDDLSEISALQTILAHVRGGLHPDEDMVNPPKGVL